MRKYKISYEHYENTNIEVVIIVRAKNKTDAEQIADDFILGNIATINIVRVYK
jgi:hypothetical protein